MAKRNPNKTEVRVAVEIAREIRKWLKANSSDNGIHVCSNDGKIEFRFTKTRVKRK
jgi:hypothetical protein